MKNPYKVLGIPQDADNNTIIRSQLLAMRKGEYSPREIAEAAVQLRSPAKRLAADFTFAIFDDFSQIRAVESTTHSKGIDIEAIDPDRYNSI